MKADGRWVKTVTIVIITHKLYYCPVSGLFRILLYSNIDNKLSFNFDLRTKRQTVNNKNCFKKNFKNIGFSFVLASRRWMYACCVIRKIRKLWRNIDLPASDVRRNHYVCAYHIIHFSWTRALESTDVNHFEESFENTLSSTWRYLLR